MRSRAGPLKRFNMLKIKFCLTFILITFITTLGFAETTNEGEGSFPFKPGEKLTFQIEWCFIPAGEAVLEVLPTETINGVKSYHFVMSVKTNSFADAFYKVRDRIDAYADVEMNHTILYKKRQREGETKRDVIVNFDWEKREAQYSISREKRKPISILPGTFDPLTVFYAFRLHNLKKDIELQIPVSDGKKCVIGKARVIRRERIEVPIGIYDTYLVEPDLEHIGGVFRKSKDAKLQIWVTADNRRIPLRVKSKVVVGSFVAELISAH